MASYRDLLKAAKADIREIDPETAEALCPTNHPLFGKRPPVGHFYYETFNEPHVSLVDVRNNPISEITATSLRTEDGTEYEADVIIFALGFDAVTGALLDIDVTGRDGVTIQERWKDGGEAYLGIFVDGFPNLMSIFGPQTAFANNPAVIERQSAFIGATIGEVQRRGADVVDVETEAVKDWVAACQMQLDATVLNTGKDRSWFLATNVEGKPPTVLFYFAGGNAYTQELADRVKGGFPGLVIEQVREGALTA